MYTQCKLTKEHKVDMAWIPSKFARTGQVLKLSGEDGWLVSEVFGSLPDDYILVRKDDWRTCFPSLVDR